MGNTKDGVYKWPTSYSLIVFSNVTTTSFEWHSRLGQPSLPILQHIMSRFSLLCISSKKIGVS
ncbi:hypothetical protein DsansV1_C12g0115151 [Dioscorea sansibarensis]